MYRNFLFFALAVLLSACNGKENEATSVALAAAKEDPSNATEGRTLDDNSARLAEKKPLVTLSTPDAETLAIGQKVYKSTCSICHKSGLNGAPRMGSKKDWGPRIAQGKEVLYGHAIHGYRGTKGSMPSRGSNPKLSEAEVKAAVDYIVEYAVPAWSVE